MSKIRKLELEVNMKILYHFMKKNEKGGKPAILNIKIRGIKFKYDWK